jgi:RNA polymerase sigma-70 factor (sigma-E family)
VDDHVSAHTGARAGTDPAAPAPPGAGIQTAEPADVTRLARPGATTFDELFRRCYERMVRVAYLLVGSQAEAEDVVQDAFARIELRWAKLDNPEAYLRRCVVNRSNDLLRRRRIEQRFRDLRRDETAELGANELGDALAGLSPRRRTAVVLKYYAGLREREIAEVMGVRPGTVKSMLHRALAQLREVIER